MLCAVCEFIFSKGPVTWRQSFETVPYHSSVEALDVAANAGCTFCVKVQAAQLLDRRDIIAYSRSDHPFWKVDQREKENRPRCIAIIGPPITDEDCLGVIRVAFDKSNDEYLTDSDNSAGKIVTLGAGPSTLESTWPQIQKWLKECREKHPKCQRDHENDAWLPTRLISISSSGGGNPSLKLCDSSDIPPDAIYTTLSHCWGPNPATVGVITTSSNIDQMKTSIAWEKLSKTFQDAVKITAKLGINFLWIDSLCIIQGSADDWIKEARLMQFVYNYSFLNIAATGAPDGRMGCFFERSPVFSMSTGMTLAWERGEEPSTYFPRVCLDQSELRDIFEQEPLNRRSWVMQERILSPRILHFTSHQMVWECHSELLFEALPNPSEYRKPTPELKMISLESAEKVKIDSWESLEKRAREMRDLWWKIIEAYALTSSTVPSDRLVAISGVAARFSRLIQSQYCWGLWETSLWSDLLWICMDKTNHTERLKAQIAPSWSWASRSDIKIKPKVVNPTSIYESKDLCREYFVDVIEASTYSIADEFNPSAGVGALQLRGFLIPIKVVQVNDFYYGVFEGEVWASGCDLDLDYKYPKVEDYGFISISVFCLPTHIREQTSARYLEGLLVELDPKEDYFRRIGCVHLSDSVAVENQERPLDKFHHFSRVRRVCLAYGKAHRGDQWNVTGYSESSVPDASQSDMHFLYGCPQYDINLL